jgi:DNA-binding MarR family transcriptional regulator
MSLDVKREIVAQLVESSRLLRNYVDQRAKARGTTRAQWVVLFRLRQQEGLSQVDLAEVLELQPISLVRLLDRLVEQALVERRPDPADRRANRLYLTAKGRQLVDDLDSLRDAIAADVLRDVPDAILRATLDTLVAIKSQVKQGAEESTSPDGESAADLKVRRGRARR